MSSQRSTPRRRRFQFGLFSLLLLMLIVSVLAAALSGMLQLSDTSLPRGFFVVMAVAAPMAVLVAVGLLRSVSRLLGRRGRR
jgi:hypothetical protein